MYDKTNNESFTSSLERAQYKACLAITGPIQGISCECLNKELHLESVGDRRWVCKLSFFYKIVKGNSPQYLSNYLKGNNNSVYNTRSASQITLYTFRNRTEKFKNSFFPFSISKSNKLSNLTKQLENITKFKYKLMEDIKSNEQ